MKPTISTLFTLTTVAVAAMLCNQAGATTITWTFMEHGKNKNLGPVSTFVEDGFALTAYGFSASGARSSLFSKFTLGDPMETGLGMVTDRGHDHEIDKVHFVQVDSILKPAKGELTRIWLGSIQGSEDGAVYGSNILGVLGTKISPNLHVDGSFDLSPFHGTYRYFGVTDIGSKFAGNTLLTSLRATVPDGGATALLLGLGLVGVGFIARRIKA